MHEKKGKEPFFFTPFCKLIFSFNQLPLQLEEKSDAFYKRMRILYMNHELKLNDAYVNELCSEESITEIIPYLLALLPVKAIPHTVKSDKMVEFLQQDSDSIHAFVMKKCIVGPNVKTNKDNLYTTYAQFCVESGRESHRKHAFTRTMRALGFREIRNSRTREAMWKGIQLKGDDD